MVNEVVFEFLRSQTFGWDFGWATNPALAPFMAYLLFGANAFYCPQDKGIQLPEREIQISSEARSVTNPSLCRDGV